MKHFKKKLPVEHFTKMRSIEEKLVKFLNKQEMINENFKKLNEYLHDQKILENKYELKPFLYLLVTISQYHHRLQNFIAKIELIIKSLQEKITVYFTNIEIFHIFHKSKLLLLLLFKFRILLPTEEIYSLIINNKKFNESKYIEYFYPEFEQYMEENDRKSIRDKIQELKESTSNDEFNQKREKGVNCNYICNLIQNDSIIDFVTYIEKNNISQSSIIQPSIYETNSLLTNRCLTLIDYSAFYGSIQIFRYLYQKNFIFDQSIWQYAIHGKNADIIHFLEENKIETLCNSYQYLIIESIKCHHNEIANYFRNNFCDKEKIYINYLYRKALKYYNYAFFSDEDISSLIKICKDDQKMNIPYYFCKYDYYIIVEFLLNEIIKLNHIYTIYKPAEKMNKDIISRIAIQNGVVDQKSEEDERIEREDPSYYRYMLCERMYTTYEYDVEITTLLSIAIRKGNIDIMKYLLSKRDIDIEIKSKNEYRVKKDEIEYYIIEEVKSILQDAVLSGYIDIVQYLLTNKAFNINNMLVINKKYHDYFSTASDDYVENYNKTLLHAAIESGYIEIVKLLLLNKKLDINLKSTSRIDKAGGCECYEESSNTIEKSTLYYAIENGNISLIKLLLENSNIDINSGIKEEYADYDETSIIQEKTPFFLAVEKQNLEIMKLLLKHPGIDVNFESTYYTYEYYTRKIYKKTALQLALQIKNDNMIQLLSKK